MQQGTVYLIHFERPFKHVQHYIGWTANLDKRMQRHRDGKGSRLLRAVNQAGISWEVVQTWDGDRGLERQLKELKNAPKLCPKCRNEMLSIPEEHGFRIRYFGRL